MHLSMSKAPCYAHYTLYRYIYFGLLYAKCKLFICETYQLTNHFTGLFQQPIKAIQYCFAMHSIQFLCYSYSPSLRYARSLAETPGKIVNQFPSEGIITNKDLLVEVACRTLKLDGHDICSAELENRGPLWLPKTFNLYTELSQFIKCFKEREQRYNLPP